MTETAPRQARGIDPLQAGVAAVLLACATAFVFYMNSNVPSREAIAAQEAVFRFEVVHDGVLLRSHGTVLPTGDPLALHVTAKDGGHLLVYRTDGQGTNLPVVPDTLESTELEPGDLKLPDALVLDEPGTWFLTAILCDDAFELDPKKPKASWSCKLREMDFVVQ